MPVYAFKCPDGHSFDRYLRVANYDDPQTCDCGKVAERMICAPMFAFVQQDVCYDSPIDGRPVTTRQQRIDDMKRAGCIEYDPGMKQDHARRLQEQEAQLDRSVETYVEREFHKMPAQAKERLSNELAAGVTAEPIRLTAGE